MRGSSSSGSFSLHRKRRVDPRMNSFGCCRSLGGGGGNREIYYLDGLLKNDGYLDRETGEEQITVVWTRRKDGG